MLNNVPVTWAVPLAALLGAVTYDLATFCTVDPPADPGIDATDVIEFLSFENPILQHAAALRIQQLIDRYAWYQMCECVGIATPAAPTAPAAPSGLPSLQPPITPSTVSACAHFSGGPVVAPNSGGDKYLIGGPTFSLADAVHIPAAPTTFQVVYTNTIAGATHKLYHFITAFFNTAGTNLGGDGTDVASGVTTTKTIAVPAGAIACNMRVQDITAGDNTNLATGTLDIYCGGSLPGQTQTPCCPPDPIATGMLTQILQYVQLLQRQLAPFAYVLGATHTALSGAGTFDIQGLLGVKVAVTTLPASLGVEGTSPAEYFDLGFITFGTDDGYPHAVRLERSTQFILPARCSAFTVLAYDLHPGVVVTITELEREP